MSWRNLERFSPILCRLLARERYGPPLTTAQLAARSGLSEIRIDILSQALTWDGIDVPTMKAYVQACRCDPLSTEDMRRVTDYLKKPTFTFLKRDKNLWQTFYRPLMKRWLDAQASGPARK